MAVYPFRAWGKLLLVVWGAFSSSSLEWTFTVNVKTETNEKGSKSYRIPIKFNFPSRHNLSNFKATQEVSREDGKLFLASRSSLSDNETTMIVFLLFRNARAEIYLRFFPRFFLAVFVDARGTLGDDSLRARGSDSSNLLRSANLLISWIMPEITPPLRNAPRHAIGVGLNPTLPRLDLGKRRRKKEDYADSREMTKIFARFFCLYEKTMSVAKFAKHWGEANIVRLKNNSGKDRQT